MGLLTPWESFSVSGIAGSVSSAAATPIQRTYELVFIDPHLPQHENLHADLIAQATGQRHLEIIPLNPARDGIAQVSQALKGRSRIDAIHFLTHGSNGTVQLGRSRLDSPRLAAGAGTLTTWGQALKTDADLLFYGCDLAAGAQGREFIQRLATLTHADVAASSDKTGHVSQGGNWKLEFNTGPIATPLVISRPMQAAWNHLLNTYPVTNANDSGAGSLRQAITDANANPGADTITFGIGAGGSVQTISVSSVLPDITGQVTIDGWTQGGGGYQGPPLINLTDTGALGFDGLRISGNGADGSTVRGLAIYGFGGHGISLQDADNVTIAGNYIGTDNTGTAAGLGNTGDGIIINGTDPDDNTIGGYNPEERNVIVGNSNRGIGITAGSGTVADNNAIIGNYIGVDATGNTALGNLNDGIVLTSFDAAGTSIIGNTIGANGDDAMDFNSSSGNIVQGNYIGTNSLGADLGNARQGIKLDGTTQDTTIGGTGAGEGNVIAFNQGGYAIEVGNDAVPATDPADRNTIRGNSIYSNSSGSILVNGFVNDGAGDADTSANEGQNPPTITSASVFGGYVTINGSLATKANSSYEIDFFSDTVASPQGRTYLGFRTVATDGTGNATFSFTIAAGAGVGDRITATATAVSAVPATENGNTSPLSNDVAIAAGTPAVTSAVAEISPTDVTTGSSTNLFTYDILATIGGGDTGVNRVTIAVPASFGDPSVVGVKVGGTSAAFTDNKSGKTISVDLTAKVVSTDTIQVLFTADAPGAADAGGQSFTSTVDDAGTPEVAQATTEGNGDGDGTDADSWTVTTTDAGCNVLMIVGSGASPNASDQAIATFLTNNGLTVFFADDGDTEAQFEAAIAANDIDVVYVSESSGSSTIGYKTANLAVGQVMGNSGNWENIDVANEDQNAVGTDIRIVDNTHYITSGYATGLQTIYSAAASRGYGNNGVGAGALVLAENPADAGQQALVVYEAGDLLYGGTPAPARRAGIFTDAEFSFWNTDAQRLLLRTILWAANTAGACDPSWTGATSAVAEITPNDVITGSSANAFTYDILVTIGAGDTGINRATATVPATFGDPTVTDVKVGGVSVAYTDNTAGKLISIDLTAKITSTNTIQILFTADAPGTADPGGQNFTSTVDDSGTAAAAQATTEGNADGDGTDANSWTVTTTDAGSGLIAHWDFDEGSGQTAADSAGSNDGTLGPTAGAESGDPTWGCVAGASALTFDGNDDEVRLSSVLIGDRDAWTISAWIKTTDLSSHRTIYSEGSTTADNYLNLYVSDDPGGFVKLYIANGDYPEVFGTTNVEDDQWHLVTMVQRTKTDRELYIDGGSDIPTPNTDDAGTLNFDMASIGYLRTQYYDADSFEGSIDDVRIYDYALTPAEISALAASPPTGTCLSNVNLSGTVFEDVNYGGGTGRNLAAAQAAAGAFTIERDGVTVELYDASGSYIGNTVTAGGGAYSFTGLTPANYSVRVINSSVTSTRTGADGSEVAVQTFRIDGDGEPAGTGANKVGGERPIDADSPANDTTQTLADLQALANQYTQSIVTVDASGGDVSGVDFGFNFDTIVNTNDTGQGSLRQFILNANLLTDNAALAQTGRTAGEENSIFMIPGAADTLGRPADPKENFGGNTNGAFTIQPQSALPAISDPVVLDGYTQTGAQANTVTSPGATDANLLIEIDGSSAGAAVDGIAITAGNCAISGLVINRFSEDGIDLSINGNNTISGNYIGTDVSGTLDRGNTLRGIMIEGSNNNVIGGTGPADRNLISGNDREGLNIRNGSAANTVIGNYIGTSADGDAPLGNGWEGI